MKILAFSFAVFAVVLLSYLPSVRYEFVGYDDQVYVYENPNVWSGISAENLRWAATSCGYASNWHPLAWMSLQLDSSLISGKPDGSGESRDPFFRRLSSVMHLHNVVLHAANATFLFLLVILMMRRLEPDKDVSLIMAALFVLLWAIHPLRTEVVCWVSERKELISVFFMLLSMMSYIGGQGHRPSSTRESSSSSVNFNLQSRPLLYLASLLLFALALMAKPVAVTLPIVLFAWDWVMTGRRFTRSAVSVAPFALMAAGACLLTLWSQVEAIEVGCGYTPLQRIVMSVAAPVIYLRQTLLPFGLSAFYPPRPSVPWAELCLGVFLLAGAVTACLAWLRHQKSSICSILAFAVAWCLVSLVPMLGVVKVGEQTHSDRYTYWVGAGLAAVVAMAVFRFVKGYEKEMTKGLALVVVVLTVATLMRMPVWRDTYSLCMDGVPKSWADVPVCVLSRLLRENGANGARQAEAMLREALMHSRSRAIGAEFAHLLAARTEKSPICVDDVDHAFDEARYEALCVLDVEPTHPLANEALAIIEMKEDKFERALGRLEQVRASSDNVGRVDRFISICRERMAVGK